MLFKVFLLSFTLFATFSAASKLENKAKLKKWVSYEDGNEIWHGDVTDSSVPDGYNFEDSTVNFELPQSGHFKPQNT